MGCVLLRKVLCRRFRRLFAFAAGGCGGSSSGGSGGDVADGGLGGGVDLEGIGLDRFGLVWGGFEKWSVERGIDAVDVVECLLLFVDGWNDCGGCGPC